MRHKVFVSYHHDNDEFYRNEFERLFALQAEAMVSRSVQMGDIDPNLNTEYTRQLIRDNYLRDSTVTVVLIGAETWKRKHVDWEISSSLRATQLSSRSGLLGILLPSYPGYQANTYNPRTIPPRLADNLANKYAAMYRWTTDPTSVQAWMHEAFVRRNQILPVNSRPMFGRNRTGDHWSD